MYSLYVSVALAFLAACLLSLASAQPYSECAPYTTLSGQVGCASLAVQRNATQSGGGEVTAAFSLVSNLPGNKTAAGSEVRGEAGSGPIWAYNEVMILAPGFAETGQSNEVDVANFTGDRGDGDGLYGLGAPWAIGHSFAALGNRNTSAMLVISYDMANPSWNRGLTFFPNSVKQAAIQDFSNAQYAVDLRGSGEYAIHQTSATSKNLLAGPVITPSLKAPSGRVYFLCIDDKGVQFSQPYPCTK